MSSREHGVWGYRDDPVGGFGEPVDQQAAHGAGPDVRQDLQPATGISPAAAAEREDEELRADILLRIGRASIGGANVEVTVANGAVVLTGSVLRPEDQQRVVTITTAVRGLKTVDDRVQVRTEGSQD